jgi:hypothetical protein
MTTDTRSDVLEHAIGADGLFVLRVNDGDLDIRGIDGDVVRVRSMDGGRMDRFEVERGEGSLTITAGHGWSLAEPATLPSSGSADLLVEVPAGATVVVEAASADVVAEHLTGEQRLRTASGDLVVRDVRGKLTADAVSGDVEIVAGGPIEAVTRTVSGDLQINAGIVRSLRATTTSGDIAIAAAFDGDGPFRIESISGDTTLEVIGDAVVEVTTLTGDVHGVGRDHRSSRDAGPIVVGSGSGPTIAFRSTSGDLAITAGRSGAAAIQVIAEDGAAVDRPGPVGGTLDILRALERGEIDVREAGRRLSATDTNDDVDEARTDG